MVNESKRKSREATNPVCTYGGTRAHRSGTTTTTSWKKVSRSVPESGGLPTCVAHGRIGTR